ncbi:unnamed protein product [Paramecium pentaurelia]|uniref:Transmembrane protein n=1 Tax=Paramecium pentaurelia TaxID=43138 RepID=A0A8S1WET9_9CILI|nr:unnamed protein product [Paramecium pentaurelia]
MIFFIILPIFTYQVLVLTRLNNKNQIQRKNIQINDENYSISNCFTYGIWSKYNPLSIIAQNGLYGQLDSNCYQLHNAIDFEQQSLNLIYYDCLDYGQKSIIKMIRFISNDNMQNKFDISIDEFDYENIWYLLSIYQWPQVNKLDLILAKNQNIIFRQQLQIKYPFQVNNVILTFGGSYKVIKSKILDIELGTIFSSFPGSIILQDFTIEDLQPNSDISNFINDAFQTINNCICQINEDQLKIQDMNLNYLDQNVYISEQINCDSFILLGWLRILEIVEIDQVFTYQFIKLNPNLDDTIYQNSNLAAFQLFYQISKQNNKIIITTYDYTFPAINIDFQNNPYLIQKEFIIPKSIINIWHYLFIQLKSNIFQIIIKFYQNGQNFEINDNFEVIQFNNIQFKLQYGNIQKQNKNYLNINVRNLMFYNCDQSINMQGCHFSCKECDGPSSSNCLSCYEESKRIYLQEYKVCICPYNSIDKNEICFTDQQQKIKIIEQHNEDQNLNCLQGFFEFNGECFKCPSIISENFISCYECYNNPKEWYTNPNCNTDLYLKSIGSIEETMMGSENIYFYFDGRDLNLCNYCWEINTIQDEVGNYDLSQYLFLRFFNFCQIEEYMITQHECYVCPIDFCKSCYVTLYEIKCSSCSDSYEFVNGICTAKILINPSEKDENLDECIPPYYITSTQQCKLCPILNCVYCFEYLSYFPTVNTLQSTLIYINQNYFKIGCALCIENYIYDFTLEKCLLQDPNVSNCLRSFINQNSQELCTLSSIDFSNSPEMNNCQIHISKCQQCLKYHSNITCVICQQGYVVEHQQCIENEELIQKTYLMQRWRIRVESFRLQFAPISQDFDNIIQIQNQCDSNCLICQIQSIYYCEQCNLNYFKQRMRVQRGEKCSDCPQLCQLCTKRSNDDIKQLQPQFIINDQNEIYTKQCLKPYLDPFINFNTYSKIAKYCINQICNYFIQIDRVINICDPIRFFNFLYNYYLDIDYFNQMGIDSIVLKATFDFQEQFCFRPFSILAKNTLKQQLFSLQKIKIILNSKETLFFLFQGIIQIYLYDSIEMNNLGFIFDSNSVSKFEFLNNNNKVDLSLTDFMIKDSFINNADPIINSLIFGDINFTNISIINTNINNSSLLNLLLWDFVGQISIETMTISNSIIINSQIFKFAKNKFTIFIKNLFIKECELLNSSVFYFMYNQFNDTSLIFQNLTIQDSKFTNSSFLDCSSQMDLQINNFSFINNIVSKSRIIGFSYNLSLFQIYVRQNIFIDSQFLSTIQILVEQQMPCKIKYLKATLNQFQNSNLFLIFSTYQISSVIIEMTELILEQNSKLSSNNQSIYLFNINCFQILIQNVLIINSNNIHLFFLFENYQIVIQDILYEQSDIKTKVQLSLHCIEQNNPINQLIQILGFVDILIQNVKVVKQISLDESLIQITSSKSYLNEISRKIKINNLQFYQNLLLQSFQIVRLSLIIIESDQNVDIQIFNIKFQQNFMHVYSEGSLLYSAGLIYIISTSSYVNINGLICYENAFTNSSNSFIIITSQLIQLQNIDVNYNNILPLSLWQEYYNITTEVEQNQDKVNSFISQVFQINTIGGVFQLSAGYIHCINSKFKSIFASKSSVFNIITFGQGIIQLVNISINQTQNDLLLRSKTSGCININSQTSLLNLSIINVIFSEVQNRMASSILSISPSSFSNYLLLKDIVIENCLSLLNQVINVQFYQQIADLNQISFYNVKIIQNFDSINKFLQSVKTITQNEILEITGSNNAAIVLENCITFINGLIFEGIYIGPLIRFINTPKLIFRNCQMNNILTLYSLNLIYVIQNIQQKSVIYFNSISIQKVSLFETNISQTIKERNDNYTILGCILNKYQYDLIEQYDYLKENVNKLKQQQQNQTNSILYVQSTSKLNEFNFHFIEFQLNNCSTCQNGIIQFDLSDFNKFSLFSLNCNFNVIKNFGCLNFQSKLKLKSKVIIQNSNFISNIGGEGVAIRVSKIPINIRSCKIINNIAEEKGGGLYIELNSNDFVIKNTIIMNNKAKIGGGIYLVGDSNLNKVNLVSSILIQNIATIYGSNIIEQPTHLALQINSNEQPTLKLEQENYKINLLNLQPYKIIEQNIIKVSNNLMIPSNQQIYKYALFNLQEKQYIKYIKQLCLYFKNSYNEVLLDLKDSSCIVQDKVISNISNKELSLSRNQSIFFDSQNNCFDIGHLSFSLDPYNQSEKYLQITLNCNSGESKKMLKYLINSNSFKCQLGEFYVDNGCQICQSNQGFYSVTYDTIKCSIFDKTKFLNITANMIQLQGGNWRPHYLSDYSQLCFKNLNFCQGGWGVGDELCKIGHIGGLCEECDINNIIGNGQYYKNQWDSRCFICQGIDNGILPFILALIQALISITLTLRSINKSNRLFSSLKIRQKFSNIIFRLNQDHESILIKMWLNYLWIFSVIFTFNINFQFQFTLIDSTSNSFYFMAYNLDCYLSNYGISLIYLRIFLILFLMLIQFCIILAGSFIYLKLKKQHIDYSILSNTLLYLFVFNYGGLIKMFCSTISIRKISNINFIQGDVSLKYGTNNHFQWITFFIIPGLLVFGCIIPLGLFLLMYIKRSQLEIIKLRKHICYLFNEYSSTNYFWEFIKISNKAIIILITTYFETDVQLKASLLGLCLLVYQILAGISKPYYLSKFNTLDLRTGQICSISIFLAAIKYVSEEFSHQFFSIALSIIIILLCIRLCFPFIMEITGVYYKRFKYPFITYLLFFVNKIKKNSLFSKYLANLLQQSKLREKRLKNNYAKLRQNISSRSKILMGSRKQNENLFFPDYLHQYSIQPRIRHFNKTVSDVSQVQTKNEIDLFFYCSKLSKNLLKSNKFKILIEFKFYNQKLI